MRQSLHGERVHVIVPKQLLSKLKRLRNETGINVSDHIRRAIEHYLADSGKARERK